MQNAEVSHRLLKTVKETGLVSFGRSERKTVLLRTSWYKNRCKFVQVGTIKVSRGKEGEF